MGWGRDRPWAWNKFRKATNEIQQMEHFKSTNETRNKLSETFHLLRMFHLLTFTKTGLYILMKKQFSLHMCRHMKLMKQFQLDEQTVDVN